MFPEPYLARAANQTGHCDMDVHARSHNPSPIPLSETFLRLLTISCDITILSILTSQEKWRVVAGHRAPYRICAVAMRFLRVPRDGAVRIS